MRISSGLFNNMVLQRDANGACDGAFSGSSDQEGEVQAKVACAEPLPQGDDWTSVGICAAGFLKSNQGNIGIVQISDIRLDVRYAD